MTDEKTPPTGTSTGGDEQAPNIERAASQGQLRMPHEHDPAGEGHMFTPDQNWPPARQDGPAGEESTSEGETTPAGPKGTVNTRGDVVSRDREEDMRT